MRAENRIYERASLLELVNDKHSCLILKPCTRKIHLRAKYLKEVKSGIKEALDQCLNKYDYSLNGILLDYQNLKVLADENSGKIIGKCGEFLVSIKGEFFVFQPDIGNLLKGVVNVKSDSHVGCLVHKRFNAMILKPEDVEPEDWNCKNIQIGDKIVFEIVDHVLSGHVPYIEGKISGQYLEKQLKKMKKSKHSGFAGDHSVQNGHYSNEDELLKNMKKAKAEFDKENFPAFSFEQKQGEEESSPNILSKEKKSAVGEEKAEMSNEAYGLETVLSSEVVISKAKKKKKKAEKDKDKDRDSDKDQVKDESDIIYQEAESSEKVKRSSLTPRPSKENPGEIVLRSETEAELLQTKKKKKKQDKNKHMKDYDDLKLSNEENDTKSKRGKKNKKKDKHNNESWDGLGKMSPLTASTPFFEEHLGEINVRPVDLIDSLMKVSASEVIRNSEVTPRKNSSPHNTKKSPVHDGTPKKAHLSGTPKRKRKESPSEKKALTGRDEDESSPARKKKYISDYFDGAKSAGRTVKAHEKSLFSDSDVSRTPQKAKSKMMLDSASSKVDAVDNNPKVTVKDGNEEIISEVLAFEEAKISSREGAKKKKEKKNKEESRGKRSKEGKSGKNTSIARESVGSPTKKKKSNTPEKDGERMLMISTVLENVRRSLGLDEAKKDKCNKSTSEEDSILQWLKQGSIKKPVQEVQKSLSKSSSTKVDSGDSGFNSLVDRKKV